MYGDEKHARIKSVMVYKTLGDEAWTKTMLHKTLIGPVVSYGVEAWTLTKKKEQVLLIFERKIF